MAQIKTYRMIDKYNGWTMECQARSPKEAYNIFSEKNPILRIESIWQQVYPKKEKCKCHK